MLARYSYIRMEAKRKALERLARLRNGAPPEAQASVNAESRSEPATGFVSKRIERVR